MHLRSKCSTQDHDVGAVQSSDAANLFIFVLLWERAAAASLPPCIFVLITPTDVANYAWTRIICHDSLDESSLLGSSSYVSRPGSSLTFTLPFPVERLLCLSLSCLSHSSTVYIGGLECPFRPCLSSLPSGRYCLPHAEAASIRRSMS